MSTDPSAILYYGIKLGEEWPLTGKDAPDAPLGYYEISEAWVEKYRPPQPTDTSNYRSPEWDAWRALFREWQKTPQNIEVNWSGAEDCECYYVHAVGLKIEVEWNEQAEIPLDLMTRNLAEHDEWIKRFCECYGLPYSQPRWHLASRYF